MMRGCGRGTRGAAFDGWRFLARNVLVQSEKTQNKGEKRMGMRDKLGEKVGTIKAVLGLVERSALIFPIGVTILAGLALALGGRVSWIPWWGALGGVLLLTLLTRKEALSHRVWACALFLLLLGGIWVWAGVMPHEGATFDNLSYHLPVTRLLIEGWNPVFAGTPEALAQTMAVDMKEMRLWHVLFMARGVELFDAAAYFFTRAPFNLFLPLFPFLLIATGGQLWRLLRPASWAMRVLGIVLLAFLVEPIALIVDCTVGLAGIGLLCAMTRRLYREPGTLLPLFCMSFWLVVSKQTGLLACFVCWVCFSVVVLCRERWRAVPFLAKMAGALLVVLCIVCASPYLTSWKHYGHPLYPAYTGDEARFPAHDITYDFRECNDDARAMGHVGAFVYAYISPAVGRAYYNWKLGKDNFAPHRPPWEQYVDDVNANVPFPDALRWQMLLAFALVALVGGKRMRFIWVAMAIMLFCFPKAYFGYLRYTPWLVGIYALAICCGSGYAWKAFRERKGLGRGAVVGCAALVLLGGVIARESPTLLRGAVFLYGQQRLNDYLASSACPPKTLFLKQDMGSPEASLRLLMRQVPQLQGAEVQILPPELEQAWTSPVRVDFCLPPRVNGKEDIVAQIQRLPDRKARLIQYPDFMVRAYAVTLPKLVWQRVKSLFR